MKTKITSPGNSRRDFIRTSSVAAMGLTILPSNVISGLGHTAPSDKLNIAGIGIGGKGHSNLIGMANREYSCPV